MKLNIKKFFAQTYIWLLLVILYAPILFIMIFSFTQSKVLGNWTGFSTKLYENVFSGNVSGGSSLLSAIENTLINNPSSSPWWRLRSAPCWAPCPR